MARPPRRRRARCPTTARCSRCRRPVSGDTPLSASARRADATMAVPPGLRGLLGAPVVGQVDSDRLEGVGHDPPGGRPARPPSDRRYRGRRRGQCRGPCDSMGRSSVAGTAREAACGGGHGEEAYPAGRPARAGLAPLDEVSSARAASVSISITTLLPTTTLPSSSEWLKLTPKSRRSMVARGREGHDGLALLHGRALARGTRGRSRPTS